MARGWESKSIESQIESAQSQNGRPHDPHGSAETSQEQKKLEREHQNLLLSRAYLLHRMEASANERYTESLRRALNAVNEKLARFKSNH